MNLFNLFTQTKEIQLLLPILVGLTMMLRTVPNLPKWIHQWIILGVSISLSLVLSGFSFDALSNGFLSAIAITYFSVGMSTKKDETQLTSYQTLIKRLQSRITPTMLPPTDKQVKQKELSLITEEELLSQLVTLVKTNIMSQVQLCDKCRLKLDSATYTDLLTPSFTDISTDTSQLGQTLQSLITSSETNFKSLADSPLSSTQELTDESLAPTIETPLEPLVAETLAPIVQSTSITSSTDLPTETALVSSIASGIAEALAPSVEALVAEALTPSADSLSSKQIEPTSEADSLSSVAALVADVLDPTVETPELTPTATLAAEVLAAELLATASETSTSIISKN